ncbi:hypothetical protein CISG_02151 [Coccidioides immitis RMSCC 3703]|uniref:Uncharacterized protein n=1 Tax=Coccidioides immitis RMSCC 3703 TaxID=454286 RepID=A0A0J8R7L1_COCIT|nr:hypothetical protein CISG_02151 [Coccidioides immitis RMSCC 3703]
MGHHWGRRHKSKHGALFAANSKKQDADEAAVRGGALVLPEPGEDDTPPRSVHADGDSHHSTDPAHVAEQLHGRLTKHVYARQVQSASDSVLVKTVIHLVRQNGATIGTYTLATLPATVSNSELGVITIPSETNSPIIVPSLSEETPASQTAPATVSATGIPSLSEVPTLSSVVDSASIPPASQPQPPTSDPASSAIITQPTNIHLAPSSPPSAVPILSSPPPVSSDVYPDTFSSASSTLIVPSLSDSETVTISPSIQTTIPSISADSTSFVFTNSTSTPTTITSTSSFSTATSSSTYSKTSTVLHVGGGGIFPTDNGGSGPTDSFTENQDSDSENLSPPRIIGAVVGSVSGFVLILLIILFAIRSRKRKSSQIRALSDTSDRDLMVGRGPTARSDFHISPRSSVIIANFFAPARALSRWRNSGQLIRSEEFTPAQRGFEKLGGRKLKSVLETGGDGYDNEFGVSEKVYESGALAKELGRVGVASPSYNPQTDKETGQSRSIPSPPLGRPASRDSDTSEQVLFRPSPARAVTTESSISRVSLPTSARTGITTQTSQPHPPPRSPLRTFSSDAVGRSHHSADGSRASRFTEGI